MSGSTIDPTKPAGPMAYTADVRGNFIAAQAQIDGLTARVTALEQSSAYFSSALLVFDYSFNTTTVAPPSSGQIRVDHTDQTLAVTLWVHDVTAAGVDAHLFIGLLEVGSIIVLQDKDDSTKVQFYKVAAAPVDSGVYTTVPVTWMKGNAPLPAQRILMTLIIGAGP